jgi:hypothetical protein
LETKLEKILTAKKKLPSVGELGKKFDEKVSVALFIRNNKEISNWLIDVFTWKESEGSSIMWTQLAQELSEFSGKEVRGDHISRAFAKWKRTGKL